MTTCFAIALSWCVLLMALIYIVRVLLRVVDAVDEDEDGGSDQ